MDEPTNQIDTVEAAEGGEDPNISATNAELIEQALSHPPLALSPAPASGGAVEALRIAELEFELVAKTHECAIADEQIERLQARLNTALAASPQPAYKITWQDDAKNPNDRRMFVDGQQWAKVYGWDKMSLDARCGILTAAMTASPSVQPAEEALALREDLGVVSREHLIALLEAAFVAGNSRQPNKYWAAEAEHYAKVTVDALATRPQHDVDKDQRIQELLEANTRYLLRARKSEELLQQSSDYLEPVTETGYKLAETIVNHLQAPWK